MIRRGFVGVVARDGERGLRLATRLEKKSGSKNGHNNCGVTSVRGGESGGGGEWTLAERGVSKMIVGPSATLLESWLSWELGGRGGAGSWGWSRDLEARRLQMTFARSIRLRCQLAGLSSQNWTPPCWRPRQVPENPPPVPDKCTSRSAFQEHDLRLSPWNQQFAAPDSGTQAQEGGQTPLDTAVFRSDS